MAFSETIKRVAKEKSHYKCCWCQQINGTLDVHHIIPQAENGPDTNDNAVPLCKNCHDTFGSNPIKRKEIREKRDWWYAYCESLNTADSVNNQKIDELITAIKYGNLKMDKQNKLITDLQKNIENLQTQNSRLFSTLDSLSPEKKQKVFAQITSTASTIVSG